MNRRQLIIGLFVIGLLSAIAPLHLPLYRLLAYESIQRPLRDGKFQYSAKRGEWLPGPKYIVPDQLCLSCQRGDHSCYSVFSLLSPVPTTELRDCANVSDDAPYFHVVSCSCGAERCTDVAPIS